MIVAVSGGVDSMALLHALHALGFELAVAHFNHLLRGAESDQDEAFVRAEAARLGIPFYPESADAGACAKSEGISVEMAARKLRHAFLARTARIAAAAKIALAHHADDQVETFWLRLLRGHAGEGLSGMRWQNPSPADSRIQLIRPLLNLEKANIREFAVSRRIPFREDSSNSILDFQRNRLRHELLPLLKNYQPQLHALTLRTAEVLGDEKAFLREQAKAASFEQAHPAVQREALRLRLLEMNLQPSFDLIENLRTSEKEVTVGRDLFLRRRSDGTILARRPGTSGFSNLELPVEIPGHASFGELQICAELAEARGTPLPCVEYFDADVLGRSILLRHWRPGDRFHPVGFGGPVKVQDLFTNDKTPAEERHRRVLAVRPDGQIFWIQGLRIGELAKVRAKTKRIVKWSWVTSSTCPEKK